MRNRIIRIPEDVFHNIACALNHYSEEGIDKVVLQLILIGIDEHEHNARWKHKYLKEIIDKYGGKNKND